MDDLDRWCRAHLGSPVAEELFRDGYLSAVVGVRLADGRQVVVKVRAGGERLRACAEVQATLHRRGFPCPEPLAMPAPLGEWVASAEAYVPDGDALPPTGRAAPPFAGALALLVSLAPAPGEVGPLAPHPPWTAWGHQGPGFWPPADDWDGDLDTVDGPVWVDDAARAARRVLGRASGPVVVGHGDWYTGNLRWAGGRLHAVHDWDSVIADREAVVAGFAAAVFAAEHAGSEPSVDESAAFLAAYQRARGRRFSVGEQESAWAAGLWLRAFDAKKQAAAGQPVRSLDEAEAAERLRRCERSCGSSGGRRA